MRELCKAAKSAPSMSALLAAAVAATAFTGVAARAATLTFDANGTAPLNDAGGTWDTTTANWFDGTNYVAWPNTAGDVAVFGVGSGAGGTVNLVAGGVTANGVTFNAPGSGAYTIGSANTLTLAGTAPTITSNVGVANTTAVPTISAFLAGTSGFTKAGTGTVLLGNTANTGLTGPILINEGTLVVGSNTTNALNGQAVTLGAATGTAGAGFLVNRNQNYNSPITVQANATAGTLRIAGGPGLSLQQTPSVTAAVTLNNNLTLGNGAGFGGGGGGVALTGGVTGDATRTITVDGASQYTIAGLGGNNSATLSSAINVNNGIFRLQSTGAGGTGLITVAGGNGAVVQGTGSALGNVTVTNGSHVAPGTNFQTTAAVGSIPTNAVTNFATPPAGGSGTATAPGAISLATAGTSTLTLTSANLDFDLAALAGGTSDRINTNALVLGAVTFNFNAMTAGSIEQNVPYTLIAAADLGPAIVLPGTINTTWTAASNITGLTATYAVNGTNDLTVTFAVPEPAALAAFGGLGAIVARRVRRRTA